MRSLGRFSTAPDASIFGGILSSNAIGHRIDLEKDGMYSVWILDDSQFAAADALLEKYLTSPAAGTRARNPVTPVHVRLAAAPLTTAFIAISVIVTLLLWYGPREISIYFFFEPHLILAGEVWRAVTPIFLHFSTLHILFNMFWLLDLGGMIERRFGKLYLLFFILIVAILSNFAQFLWDGIGFGGMSGVIYGLFGFIWIRSKYDPTPDFGIDRNSVITMIGWLFLCMTGVIGPIGNAAHVSGLLLGVAWGWSARILK